MLGSAQWNEHEDPAIIAVTRRPLAIVDPLLRAPEADNLPLLTRLVLFSADSGHRIADVCTVGIIEERIVRFEIEKLAQQNVVSLCPATDGLSLTGEQGRRLWNDFNQVRAFRKAGHRMIFDPLARALRWFAPSDAFAGEPVQVAPIRLSSRQRSDLTQTRIEILARMMAEVSPGLAEMMSDREDGPVEVSLIPGSGTLNARLPLPFGMVMLPHPHTAIDPRIWRQGTERHAVPWSGGDSIQGPALRVRVSAAGRERRALPPVSYLFDQVTGVLHKETDVASYVVGPAVVDSSPDGAFLLPERHSEASLCEGLLSGLLGHLLPDRGRDCRDVRWVIDPEPVTLRRAADEAGMAECASIQARREGGWSFLFQTQADDALDARDQKV